MVRDEEVRLKRKVAIKVMRPELYASVGAERFLREVGLAARLAHPHIVPLIDSGSADGMLYSVSPYVPGGSLRDRLARESPLPIPEALSILREDPATAHIPVVALSANAMPRDIEKGLQAGFFRYLTKPIKVHEFMETLDVALEFAGQEVCQAK